MLPSGKKNNTAEKQLVNGSGQINIGRHRPLGEIRGMGSGQHQRSLNAAASVTVPSCLSSLGFRKFFIQKPRMCQGQGLPFSALEVQDRKALCQLGFSPGSDNGFLNQKDRR